MRNILGVSIFLSFLNVVHVRKNFLKSEQKPTIIFILADDLGWNEVSWHNKRIKTPFLEALSETHGVRLEQSYVAPKCSPSRAALMTGIYPFRLGMQRNAIERFQPVGMNSSLQTLPQLLKQGGYATHIVGKWHLGYCNQEYLPNNRGFDSFFGQYTHKTDYYSRKLNFERSLRYKNSDAYDLHENSSPTFEGGKEFSTDLYTRKAATVIKNHPSDKPLFLYLSYQAPHMPFTGQYPPSKYMNLYKNSTLYQNNLKQDRDAVARVAAVSAIDSGVKQVVKALKMSGLYDNSIIIFSSDNGGSHDVSNYPLRGRKEQVYEGGVRAAGFVHSKLIKRPGKGKPGKSRLMYITDWMSTLLHVAGLDAFLPPNVDSINMWPVISHGIQSLRNEVVLNLDQDPFAGTWSAVIRSDKYKLIWGQQHLLKFRMADQTCNQELYDLDADPNEEHNLIQIGSSDKKAAKKAGLLRSRLMEHFKTMVPAVDPPSSRAADPANFGGVISTGWC